MYKKTIFVSLVLCSFMLSGMADKALLGADAQVGPRVLYEEIEHYELIEEVYRDITSDYPGADQILDSLLKAATEAEKQAEYERAKNAYQQIIQQYPYASLVSRAQLDLARMDILSFLKSGNDAAAEAAIYKLLTDFSENKHIAEAVHHTAYRCRLSGKHEKAERLDGYVTKNWPQSDYALWAQMDKAESNIDLGDEAAAQAEIDKLIADFAGHPRIAEAAHHVAFHYQRLKKYDKARQLDEYVIAHWPTSDFALWAQMDIAEFNIERGDDAAAVTAIAELLAGFAGHPRIAEAVHHTAYHCRQLRKYEKANQLDQYVTDHWPDTNYALWAQMDMAGTYIELGEQAAAEIMINNLIADFNDYPELPQAIFTIGEEYYEKTSRLENEGRDAEARGNLEKTLAVWKRIIEEFPKLNSTVTAHAYYFSAECYRQLAQHSKAIEYYQKIVDDWPKYEYAWNAQFMVGRIYEDLKESGTISAAQADPKTKAAYEQLLQKYPDCAAAKIAQRWLTRHNSSK